jgi:hypothetical protein
MRRIQLPRMSQLLFLAATMVLAGASYILVSLLCFPLADQDDELRKLQFQRSRYQSVIEKKRGIDAALKALKEGNQNGMFLAGDSEGAINANLIARLKQISERSGVRIQSIQPLDLRGIGAAKDPAAHLTISGTNNTVYTALTAIEDDVPFLFVTSLMIRAPIVPPGAAQTQEPTLDVQLDVYGATNASPSR